MAKRRKRRPPAGGTRRTSASPRRIEAEPPARGRRALLVRIAVLAAALALGWLLFIRAPGPGEVSPEALNAATAAGCGDLERPVVPDPSRAHLGPGDTIDEDDPPPAAGPHDPSPLPPDPHVHAEPVSEARAIHNLEHASVLIWYRPTSEGGLSVDAIASLEELARDEDLVIMAPYPRMPDGTALALVAWNTRWRCPAGISPDQSTALARGFVDAYRGTTNAPEAPRGLLGRLFSG